MKKLIAGLAMVAASVAFVPQPAVAQDSDCTDNYVKCLNDSFELGGLLLLLADIECFADYVGCVAAEIILN